MGTGKYRKAIAAVVGAIGLIAGPEYIPAPEAITQLVMAVIAVAAVYMAPNDPAE